MVKFILIYLNFCKKSATQEPPPGTVGGQGRVWGGQPGQGVQEPGRARGGWGLQEGRDVGQSPRVGAGRGTGGLGVMAGMGGTGVNWHSWGCGASEHSWNMGQVSIAGVWGRLEQLDK